MQKSGKGKELLFLSHQAHMESTSSYSGSNVVFPCSDSLFSRNYVPETLSAKSLHLEITKNENCNKNEQMRK